MRDWKGDPPNLYDISGSAHFINKCDNGVVVHRNNDPNKGPQSEVRPIVLRKSGFAQVLYQLCMTPLCARLQVNILVRKVRNKAAGSIGE
jgi:hypothetical protein